MKNNHNDLYDWVYWELLGRAYQEFGEASPDTLPDEVSGLLWDTMVAWEAYLQKEVAHE